MSIKALTRVFLGMGVLALSVAWCVLGIPIHSMLIAVLIGWFNVLQRIAPLITFNPVALLTAAIVLGGSVYALHCFAGWLYREIRVKQDRYLWPIQWRFRWTISLLFGVFLMFVAGLVGVGLFRTSSWLFHTDHFLQTSKHQFP
jgi:hypothetical protein